MEHAHDRIDNRPVAANVRKSGQEKEGMYEFESS